jgi:hypothetical protein
MTDEQRQTPPPADAPEAEAPQAIQTDVPQEDAPSEPVLPYDGAPPVSNGANTPAPEPPAAPPSLPEESRYDDRLERLGGEPAPVITPEEFARLQRQGQVNIDARGRVRTTRRSDAEAGVSLRKRRAWYVT